MDWSLTDLYDYSEPRSSATWILDGGLTVTLWAIERGRRRLRSHVTGGDNINDMGLRRRQQTYNAYNVYEWYR